MKFGIKINNYEAASIYGVNIGIRDHLESTPAMLTNSLFLDFLALEGDFTRDVICLEFNYGSPSYEEEVKRAPELLQRIEERKARYAPITKGNLRVLYYTQGVSISYPHETIHYKMLFRTPGKAKKGTCMFIRDELYDKAHDFLYMGYELPKENAPIVEIGAYASLITSSIVGRVKIEPQQMLIVEDLKTHMEAPAVLVKTDAHKHCYVERVRAYDMAGEAFDGQALIDSSIFPRELDNGEAADGYVLLRHHMTKCAAFSANIIQFMKDQYGDDYETATITDMFGRAVRVRDVRFITTNNAIKWLKFGITFDYWCEWLAKNDYMWGVVKTTHKSKFGRVQRMSYQMTNALDIESMGEVVRYSVNYIEKLKSNDESYFLDYLRQNANFFNDYEVLLALVEQNAEFIRSEYYRSRKKSIISAYVLDFKSGRVMQNADNLTIVGSPYGMLLHAIGKDAREDPTFRVEGDCIQCWCGKFKDGEYLAEFRSPFNSRNNLGYLHNTYHEYMDRYFNLGKLCIAVNTIDTDWQNRNNGADQDSDSIYTTNQPNIVAHAKYCYEHYPTIVNEIKLEKNKYDLSLENYALIDNNLTACQQAIGQSSNLAQIALTYTYNFSDQKYDDYVCILAVLAQVAIDNAKRKFDVELDKEIPRIKRDLDIEANRLPKFWLITKKDKRKCSSDKQRAQRQRENKKRIRANINEELVCPMNYLYDLNLKYERNPESTLTMDNFFIKHEMTEHKRKSKKVEELIEKYSLVLNNCHKEPDSDDNYLLLRADFDDLIRDIRGIYISKNYLGMMSWLINRAFQITPQTRGNMNSNLNKNKALLMKVLYSVNPDCFLKCFKTLEEMDSAILQNG